MLLSCSVEILLFVGAEQSMEVDDADAGDTYSDFHKTLEAKTESE